jgi:hypothetical protein
VFSPDVNNKGYLGISCHTYAATIIIREEHRIQLKTVI